MQDAPDAHRGQTLSDCPTQCSDLKRELGHDSANNDSAMTSRFWCGQDEAADSSLANQQGALPAEEKSELPALPEDQNASDEDDELFQVPVPADTTGTVTQAYKLALHNRIKIGKTGKHDEWSLSAYTPVFIHDCLMQPGSLAELLGKMPPDIIPRMTPALLPGFHPHVHSDTHKPCVIQSPNSQDYVQGMLVFGEGKAGRKSIHQHYGPNTRRVTVEVQCDFAVPVLAPSREHAHERWRLQRHKVRASAWLWANVGSGDVHLRNVVPKWTLEDYVEGKLEGERGMRVEESPWMEETLAVPGSVSDDRADGFNGW